MTIYEKHLPRNLPYAVPWIILATAILFAVRLVAWVFDKKLVFSDWSIIALVVYWLFSFFPCMVIFLSKSFQFMMEELKLFLQPPNDTSENWLDKEYEKIFSFSTRLSVSTILLITGLSVLTLLSVKEIPIIFSPKGYEAWKWPLIVLLTPIFAMSGHGGYIYLALFFFIKKVSQYRAKVSFFLIHSNGIEALKSFYTTLAFVSVIGLGGLALCVYLGFGQKFPPEMGLFFSIVALYPVTAFSWSFFQIHQLMHRFKREQLTRINSKVHTTFNCYLKDENVENSERLRNLVEIQKNIENQRDWPIDFGGIITFLGTFGAAFFQIYQILKD